MKKLGGLRIDSDTYILYWLSRIGRVKALLLWKYIIGVASTCISFSALVVRDKKREENGGEFQFFDSRMQRFFNQQLFVIIISKKFFKKDNSVSE
jgi:hypothetical protein